MKLTNVHKAILKCISEDTNELRAMVPIVGVPFNEFYEALTYLKEQCFVRRDSNSSKFYLTELGANVVENYM